MEVTTLCKIRLMITKSFAGIALRLNECYRQYCGWGCATL
jgi:hypothetical protein